MAPRTKRVKAIKMSGTLPVITRGTSPETTTGFPVEHYSHSSLVKFSTNPIMFKINYMNRDRIASTKNVSGVVGTAFHKAMEVYYRGNPDMMPVDDAQAIEFGLKTGMNFLEQYNDGFIEFSEKIKNKQDAYDRLSFLFTSYVKEKPHNPTETLLATEDPILEKINVEWRGQKLNLPVPLKGFLDKVIRQDGKIKIIDYKTCSSFSDPEKIDGEKMIQAVMYYLLVYAKYGEAPYSFTFEEAKMTKNREGGPQIQHYEIVYADHEMYFDFFFRFYQDVTDALNGKMVYVPNVKTFFDNEVSIIAYIHRLDEPEKQAELMKQLKVDNITDLLKAKIQSAGNMRQLMKVVEQKFVSAKNLNYERMTNEEKIQTKLLEHGMMLSHESTIQGASVDLYRYLPSIGLKMSRIATYVADVEQVLGMSGIRILAPIPGSNLVGFEVPRLVRSFPALPTGAKNYNLAIGLNIMGQVRHYDLRDAPHMLVAGSTGSGKSIFLHNIIKQLRAHPGVTIRLYDPKQVEFRIYEGSVEEVQSEPEAIELSLLCLYDEMEKRYKALADSGHRDAKEAGWPPIFAIVDEYADLAMRKRSSVPATIQKIAQKGRAAGIHLIVATQRASTKIITGDVKVNFPVKAVFRMAKVVDSMVMLDEGGAEKLLGKGDLLFSSNDGIERLQAFAP